MKRLRGLLALTVALMLVLLCAVQAENAAVAEGSNTGWREGLSPARPYVGVPEVDLNERLGYMVFSPTHKKNVERSCQKLFVYLPRTDVKAGDGLLHLFSEAGEELWQTPMGDADAVTLRDMTAAELDSMLWGGGIAFEIKLPRSLELGKTYYIDLDGDCIRTQNDALKSNPISGREEWWFALVGDYGVSAAEYLRPLVSDTPEPTQTPEPTPTPDPRITQDPQATAALSQELIDLANGVTPEPTVEPTVEYQTVLKPQGGDQIRFDLVLGGEAATAVVYGYNGTVDFPLITFNESCEVRGDVLAEVPAWGVMFLDAQGNELNRVEMR